MVSPDLGRTLASSPAEVKLFQAVGPKADPSQEPSGWQSSGACKALAPTPYAVHLGEITDTLDLFLTGPLGE